MKIIFLDMDGVCNGEKTFIDNHFIWKETGENVGDVGEEYIIRLAEIVKATGAKIVMSSSWRGSVKHHYTIDKDTSNQDVMLLDVLLEKYNLEIYDYTGSCGGEYEDNTTRRDRGQEVRFYLLAHEEIRSFVILDDDSFSDWFWLKKFWVKTTFYGERCGLQDIHVKEAIDILNYTERLNTFVINEGFLRFGEGNVMVAIDYNGLKFSIIRDKYPVGSTVSKDETLKEHNIVKEIVLFLDPEDYSRFIELLDGIDEFNTFFKFKNIVFTFNGYQVDSINIIKNYINILCNNEQYMHSHSV